MDEIPKLLVGAFAMNTPSLAVPQVVEQVHDVPDDAWVCFFQTTPPNLLSWRRRRRSGEGGGRSVWRVGGAPFAVEEPVSRHEETLHSSSVVSVLLWNLSVDVWESLERSLFLFLAVL